MKTLLLLAVLGTAFLLPAQIVNGGGGASTNPTTGTIPVKSGASTFGDSPLTVSGGNVVNSGTETATGFLCSGANCYIDISFAAAPANPTGTTRRFFCLDGAGCGDLDSNGNINYIGNLPINTQSGASYTVLATDAGKLTIFTNSGAIAVTLPDASTTTTSGFYTGRIFRFFNSGTGTVTISRTTTSTINGGTTLIVYPGNFAGLVSDGTNWQAPGVDPSQIVAGSTFKTLGTTAGGIVATQGSTNGHATANTVTLEAPAAVTAYEALLPAAAANGIPRWANSSSVVTESVSELSGDCATSGSNAVICTQINGSNFAVNSSGLPTKVDGITTAGQGVDIVQCITSAKVETGADAAVLSCTPASAVGGYEVCVAIDVSAANTATLGWTATWTNTKTNANAPTNLSLFQMGVAAPALTFTAAANNSYYSCVPIGVSAAGTAIVVKTTFSGTSIAYNVSAWIKRAI